VPSEIRHRPFGAVGSYNPAPVVCGLAVDKTAAPLLRAVILTAGGVIAEIGERGAVQIPKDPLRPSHVSGGRSNYVVSREMSSLLYALVVSSPARHAFEPAWKIVSRNHHDYNAGHDPHDAMRTLIRSNDAAQGMLALSS
jgi:hypothetical protein